MLFMSLYTLVVSLWIFSFTWWFLVRLNEKPDKPCSLSDNQAFAMAFFLVMLNIATFLVFGAWVIYLASRCG